jgi:hypothetical protein
MGDREEAYMVLVEGSKESEPLVNPRHRWEDNIKMDLQEVEWRGPDWIALGPDLAGGWRLGMP